MPEQIIEDSQASEIIFNEPLLAEPGNIPPQNFTMPWWFRRKPLKNASPEVYGWKPLTLRGPVLGSFIAFSILVIAVLEFLSSRSSGDENAGGLVFASDIDHLPTFPRFCLSWGWVDLDVKRLEPWFRLSSVDGAKAVDSLLLEYPSEFLPFVPITAFKRRHWSVFFAGTIMLVVFWVITPLQSAIFNTGIITREISTPMITSAYLVPMEQQLASLSVNFLNQAYAISWLGQALPAFTTLNYVVSPFGPSTAQQSLASTETWTTEADAFSTTLSCSPAIVNITRIGYTFSNGRGCDVPEFELMPPDNATFMVNYVGYWDDAEVDWSLQTGGCPVEFSNSFLAVWASASSYQNDNRTYDNLTALFCETAYASAKYKVTVNSSDLAIVGGSEIVTSERTSSVVDVKSVFNTTAFEYIIATSVNPTEQKQDLPSYAVLNQDLRLLNYSIVRPVSDVVGFALALNPVTVEDLHDPAALQYAFQQAHQLLFATAFSSLLNSTNPLPLKQIPRPGVVGATVGAIILVRPVAMVVEIAFGLIAVVTGFLWIYSYRRISRLYKDPASVADVMAIYHSDRLSPAAFDLQEESSKAALVKAIAEKTYHLMPSGGQTNKPSSTSPRYISHKSTIDSSVTRHEILPCVSPFELRWYTGVVFIILIFLSILGLALLNYKSRLLNGLSLPSNNSVVLSILENYAPTVFATFLEPVWVVLNRQLCLLTPFEELRKGNSKSSRSLEATYSSLPPQLNIWRAIGSGHFLLATVCLIALSNNILAITLSTLINEGMAESLHPIVSVQPYMPIIKDSKVQTGEKGDRILGYSDHFYMMLANLTLNTSLAPWVDDKHYYLPFNLEIPPSVSTSAVPTILQKLKSTTTGFGTSINCTNLSRGSGPDTYQFNISRDGLTGHLSTTHSLPDGGVVTCPVNGLRSTNGSAALVPDSTGAPTGMLALEVMQAMSSPYDDRGFCASVLVAGWARAIPTYSPVLSTSNFTHPEMLVGSTFVACTSKPQSAQFDIEVDMSGHVLDANRTTEFSSTPTQYSANATESSLVVEALQLLTPSKVGTFQWHNTTATYDWMNSLLVMMEGSHALVDPSLPVPNGTAVALVLEKLYTQMFSLVLSLNAEVMFVPNSANETTVVYAIGTVQRLFLDQTMFKVSVAILLLHLLIAIAVYTSRPKSFLPRMPISIAAILSYVTASRALSDFVDHDGGLRRPHKEQRYAFGRYIGTDGKSHVGIEQQRFVVPLESKNPEFRRRKWQWNSGGKKKVEPKTWI